MFGGAQTTTLAPIFSSSQIENVSPKFLFDGPEDAMAALAGHLRCSSSTSTTADLTGRVLAENVVADRDSPAADVSAMDGYAVRLSDIQTDTPIPVRGESAAGSEPPPMSPGAAIRIFTGAIVPQGAEAVVKREDTRESGDEILLLPSAAASRPGEHIRRAGENAETGNTVLGSGTLVTAAQRATMTNFGAGEAAVFDPVRVAVLTTGDEVGDFEKEPPQPWQLRNSNRASVRAMLDPHRWIQCDSVGHCIDDPVALKEAITRLLGDHDAIALTGGVSMGDYDHVPDVVQEVGGQIVFHGLPIRPGKPILGAATVDGKLILGLPGNPVSATIGAHRFLIPLLAKMSGQTRWQRPRATVRLTNPGEKTIPLHWMKLVRLEKTGLAEVVVSQGSGDLVSLGQSDGYVSVPPGESGEGPWPYFAW